MRLLTKSVAWSADAAGMNLLLRTSQAKRIAETVKPDKTYIVEIREFKKKRTLDQNAMYWSILTQFAKEVGMSNAEAHNRMLRSYGEPEVIDGKLVFVVLPDTDEAERKALDAETYHLRPTSQTRTGKDGRTYRTYTLMRGSSTYNASEFRCLLDGLLDTCKQVGIELEDAYGRERL